MRPRWALVVVCVLLWWPEAARAQDVDTNLWFVRGGVTPAFILPTNPFGPGAATASDPIGLAPNVTLEIGRRTDGTSAWHTLYGQPSYGFGFSLVPLPNGDENSRPVEAYTFFSWPFARLTERLQVTTDFGMGLSWRWKHMDDATDTYENVLGSNLNARVNWGFYLRYLSTPKVVVYTGVDYTHRSNGGLVQPDLGINVIGPKIAIQYNLAPETPTQRETNLPPFQPAWEFVVGGMGGVKNVVERKDPLVRSNFGAFSTTAALQRHFYQFGRVAVGTDMTYDGATGARIDGSDRKWRATAGQRWGVGLYGGYEHIIDRFSVLMQAGSNVARGFTYGNPSRLYSRYGWRYRFSERVSTSLAIRAHGLWRANVLEFGVGYRVWRTPR